MIAHFKVQVDDAQRRAIAHHRGKSGFATRRDVVAELDHLFTEFMAKLPEAPERKRKRRDRDTEEALSSFRTAGLVADRCPATSSEGDPCWEAIGHEGQHGSLRPDGKVIWSKAPGARVWYD